MKRPGWSTPLARVLRTPPLGLFSSPFLVVSRTGDPIGLGGRGVLHLDSGVR